MKERGWSPCNRGENGAKVCRGSLVFLFSFSKVGGGGSCLVWQRVGGPAA